MISGYMAGLGKRLQSILIVSFFTAALAGIVGFGTIGFAPEAGNVTGIGWTSDTLILVWIVLNLLLTLTTGYLEFRLGEDS